MACSHKDNHTCTCYVMNANNCFMVRYIDLNQDKDKMPWPKGQTCSMSSMGFFSYTLWSELPQLSHNHHKIKCAPIREENNGMVWFVCP